MKSVWTIIKNQPQFNQLKQSRTCYLCMKRIWKINPPIAFSDCILKTSTAASYIFITVLVDKNLWWDGRVENGGLRYRCAKRDEIYQK